MGCGGIGIHENQLTMIHRSGYLRANRLRQGKAEPGDQYGRGKVSAVHLHGPSFTKRFARTQRLLTRQPDCNLPRGRQNHRSNPEHNQIPLTKRLNEYSQPSCESRASQILKTQILGIAELPAEKKEAQCGHKALALLEL
jgi:hypothetical protein